MCLAAFVSLGVAMEVHEDLSQSLQHERYEHVAFDEYAPVCRHGEYKQLKTPVNGCGSQAVAAFQQIVTETLETLPPSFHRCCDGHDICYGTCGKTKFECDETFGACLRHAAEQFSLAKGRYYQGTAVVVKQAVALAGKAAYTDAQRTYCKCTDGMKLRFQPKTVMARALSIAKRAARTTFSRAKNMTTDLMNSTSLGHSMRIVKDNFKNLTKDFTSSEEGRKVMDVAGRVGGAVKEGFDKAAWGLTKAGVQGVLAGGSIVVAAGQTLNNGANKIAKLAGVEREWNTTKLVSKAMLNVAQAGARQAARNATRSVVDAVRRSVETVKNKTAELKTKAGEIKAKALDMKAKATEKISALKAKAGDVKAKALNLKAKAAEKISALKAKVDRADDAIDRKTEAAKQAIRKTTDRVKAATTKVVDRTRASVKKVTDRVRANVKRAVARTRAAMTRAFSAWRKFTSRARAAITRKRATRRTTAARRAKTTTRRAPLKPCPKNKIGKKLSREDKEKYDC